MEELLSDFRYAIRGLLKNRGFTIIAVVILAIGIGANTAVFTIVDPILLRPPNLPAPEELARVYVEVPEKGRLRGGVGVGEFYGWRERGLESFEQFAAYYGGQTILTQDGQSARLDYAAVSEDFFATLDVATSYGRVFSPDETWPGNSGVIILSHRLWMQRFGGDPGVIGDTVRLGGEPTEVVGIMPQGFAYPSERVEFWVPMAFGPDLRASLEARYLAVLGRRAAGVTLEGAQAEFATLAAEAATDRPESNAGVMYRVSDFLSDRVVDVRLGLLFLQVAVGLLLLIACIDVANLLLARARHRVREMALRFALGASKGRLIRLMLSEAAMLAVLGACGAVLVAWWILDLFSAILTDAAAAGYGTIALDGRIFLFTLLAAGFTVLLFGLAPALVLSRGSLARTMRDGGRGMSVGRDVARLGRSLVFGQVALATLLAIGAALAGLSLSRLLDVDLGFQTASVTTLQVSLPSGTYGDDHRVVGFYDRLLPEVAALPGVDEAGAVNWLPVGGSWSCRYQISGRPAPQDAREVEQGLWRTVRPGYFETLGIPLRSGRLFDQRDVGAASQVIVINEALAAQSFQAGNPLGQRMRFDCENGATDDAPAPWRTIVGVVGNVRQYGVTADFGPGYYVPHSQLPWDDMSLAVRGPISPPELASAVRAAAAAIDPEVAVHDVELMDARVRSTLALPHAQGLLAGCFAVMALVLGGFGIYGLLSFRVAERRYEFGIRAALGATARSLERMVLGDGMRLVIAGLVVGCGLALVLARVVSGFLYGVSATDPLVYGAAVLVLGLIGLLASWVPARRAARVDVSKTLRAD